MITKEEIEKLAVLSQLYVSDDEISQLQSELSKMISFAHELNNWDKDKNTDSVYMIKEEAFLRNDEEVSSYPREEVLSNAPLCSDGYFLVRKSEQDGKNRVSS